MFVMSPDSNPLSIWAAMSGVRCWDVATSSTQYSFCSSLTNLRQQNTTANIIKARANGYPLDIQKKYHSSLRKPSGRPRTSSIKPEEVSLVDENRGLAYSIHLPTLESVPSIRTKSVSKGLARPAL